MAHCKWRDVCPHGINHDPSCKTKKVQRMKNVSEQAIRRLIKYKGPCCMSCHDDADEFDYEMCNIYSEDFQRRAEVCCAVKVAFDKWQQERKNHDTKTM